MCAHVWKITPVRQTCVVQLNSRSKYKRIKQMCCTVEEKLVIIGILYDVSVLCHFGPKTVTNTDWGREIRDLNAIVGMLLTI